MGYTLSAVFCASVVVMGAVPFVHAEIPGWIKNVAGMWADGLISDAEYTAGIEWLINEGVITVDQAIPADKSCAELESEELLYSAAVMGVLFTVEFGELAELRSSDANKLSSLHNLYAFELNEIAVKLSNCDTKYHEAGWLIARANDALDALNDFVSGFSGGSGSRGGNLFVDSTGYEPAWAKSMGEQQAMSKCMNVVSDFDNYGSRDFDWCQEFSGWVLDKLTGN